MRKKCTDAVGTAADGAGVLYIDTISDGPREVTIENCRFTDNELTQFESPGVESLQGAALRINGANVVTIRNSLFTENHIQASSDRDAEGGAVAISTTGTVTVQRCQFENNSVSGRLGTGGALSVFGEIADVELKIHNTLFRGNSVSMLF